MSPTSPTPHCTPPPGLRLNQRRPRCVAANNCKSCWSRLGKRLESSRRRLPLQTAGDCKTVGAVVGIRRKWLVLTVTVTLTGTRGVRASLPEPSKLRPGLSVCSVFACVVYLPVFAFRSQGALRRPAPILNKFLGTAPVGKVGLRGGAVFVLQKEPPAIGAGGLSITFICSTLPSNSLQMPPTAFSNHSPLFLSAPNCF